MLYRSSRVASDRRVRRRHTHRDRQPPHYPGRGPATSMVTCEGALNDERACRPGTPPAPDFSAAFPQRATPFPPVQTTPKSISDHECNASTTARQRHVGSHITGEVTSAWGGRIPCELLGISHAGLPRLAPRVARSCPGRASRRTWSQRR
jgi:hypothetical protein